MKNYRGAWKILVVAAAAMCSTYGMEAPGLQQKLQSEYPLTTPTADNTDIVTAGCVITFVKRGLTASAVTSGGPAVNTYKNKEPQIHPSTMTSLRHGRFGIPIPGSDNGDTRVFVNGEKMFIIKVDVDLSKDTVTFGLISDAYNDVRYHALLRFDFPKQTLSTTDAAQVQAVIDQAFMIAPPDPAPPAAQTPAPGRTPPGVVPPAPAPAAPASQPEPAMAPIPPPPPPPADPKAITLGQTPDQVVGILGAPAKVVKLGTKEVYYYKDMKVIFVNGKMTDAQ